MSARACLLLAFLPVVAAAYTPNEGVEFELHKGFFAETDIGTMFSVGGRDAYSNTESFIQLGVGVDIGSHFEVGALFGLGTSNVNCFAQGSAVLGTCTAADSFTVAMLDGFVTYLVPLQPRLWLTPKLLAGYTNLDPNPVVVDSHAVYTAANVGVGVGIEYATSLEHFNVGVDVTGRYVLSANVPTIAILPRIKYTF